MCQWACSTVRFLCPKVQSRFDRVKDDCRRSPAFQAATCSKWIFTILTQAFARPCFSLPRCVNHNLSRWQRKRLSESVDVQSFQADFSLSCPNDLVVLSNVWRCVAWNPTVMRLLGPWVSNFKSGPPSESSSLPR